MTVFEMLNLKYCEEMKTMSAERWERIRSMKPHPAKTVFMGLEITADDIRRHGGWSGEFFAEIDRMHKEKLLASNKHRQYQGQVTKYWLTAKGFARMNKNHSIC